MNEIENRKSKIENPPVLAVIMARGGSIGLPGKAMKPLLGRPVIGYTLDHVRESRLVSNAVVSSDDPAILDYACSEGFETIERPAELATPTSATDPVIRHAVRALYPHAFRTGGTTEGTENTETTTESGRNGSVPSVSSVVNPVLPFAVVMLYGNVPLRRNRMIDRCLELLLSTGCDSVQTIAPVGKFHPYWMFDYSGDGRIAKHIPNNVYRRQELPPLYVPTGSVYAMRTPVLMAAENDPDPHAFLGADRRGLIVSPEDSVDIDSPKDLYVAEAILRSEGAAETATMVLR